MDQPPPTLPPGGQGPDWDAMRNKMTAARGPDRLIMVAGFLFLIATFLPWYRVRLVGFASASESAWGSQGLGVLAALLGVATFALAVALVVGAAKPSAGTNMLMLALAGGTLLFTFLRLVFQLGGDAARSIEILSRGNVKITRGIGLWAGIVLAAVMTYGAFQKYKGSDSARA